MVQCIQIGKELGIPATAVENLHGRWKFAVSTYWEAQRRESEMSRRKSSRKAKTASGSKKTRGT